MDSENFDAIFLIIFDVFVDFIYFGNDLDWVQCFSALDPLINFIKYL